MATATQPRIEIVKRDAWVPSRIAALLRGFRPHSQLGKIIRSCLQHLPPEQAADLLNHLTSTLVIESSLALVHYRWDDTLGLQVPENHGVVSKKVITTAGVNFLVDAWQNTKEMENFKYHGVGTTNTAEASGDTALAAESTTILNPDSTRATGSLTEGASANIFRTVGTNTFDGSGALVEHGIFDQAATGGGTLWDRSVFSTVNVANGDSLQATYDMTASAGG